MKNLSFFIFLVFISLSSNAFAQYGGNSGYSNSPITRSRDDEEFQKQLHKPSKQKEIPVEEMAAETAKGMKEPLKLDELQTIAITNVLTDNFKSRNVLLKQDYTQEELIKHLNALAETTDQQINQFLNKDQKELYIAYKEDLRTPKKPEEKSKSKKNKKEKKEKKD